MVYVGVPRGLKKSPRTLPSTYQFRFPIVFTTAFQRVVLRFRIVYETCLKLSDKDVHTRRHSIIPAG